MRPMITPMVVMSVDSERFSDDSNFERQKLFVAQVEHQDILYKKMEGSWQGTPEVTFVIFTPAEDDKQRALILAQQWDQQYVCIVNADSSAYQHTVNNGVEKFKGYWKQVKPWQVPKFLKDGGDYTYDPEANVYWTVGS